MCGVVCISLSGEGLDLFMKIKMVLIGWMIFLLLCNPANAKALLLGDSLTAGYANSYRELINNKVNVEYMSGSGLMNGNKKDWLNFVNNTDLREYDDIIISLGTNDFVLNNVKSREEYYIRLFKFIAEIQKQNPLATIIWLSPPHLKNPEHECYLINTRHITQRSADLMRVKYLDINQPHILGIDWQSMIDGQKIRTDDEYILPTTAVSV